MKKLIKGLKKIFLMIGTFFTFIYTKVLAISPPDMIAVEPQVSYGIPRLTPIKMILRITKTLIVPFALIIGFIIYFKKSKSSNKKKIIVTIGIVIISILLYCIVNYLLYVI